MVHWYKKDLTEFSTKVHSDAVVGHGSKAKISSEYAKTSASDLISHL